MYDEMKTADPNHYLDPVVQILKTHWPANRCVNVVCHGHSVPAGYFATPRVDTFNAYPYLLHRGLKDRFPFAVINVIVTAIGGENSERGAARFEDTVLCHRPDVLTLDYALNDRRIGLAASEAAWRSMIENALSRDVKVLLMTPTADSALTAAVTGERDAESALALEPYPLRDHAELIRRLAGEYGVGLADSFAAFEKYLAQGGALSDLLSWSNHPSRKGHELATRELLCWFPAFGG
ncbi:MAG TPA: lipase [Clostridiales bacterium]|nr:lipase [Clostridiales bacterium]